jgi:hypothetical protein
VSDGIEVTVGDKKVFVANGTDGKDGEDGKTVTKMSELTNDMEYLRKNDKVSELTNDMGYLRKENEDISLSAHQTRISGGSFVVEKLSYGMSVTGNRIEDVGTPEADTDAANKAYVENAVKKKKVPTKVSELTNDNGYITAKDVPEVEVPTKLSQLTNDKGYITSKDISAVHTFGNYESFYTGLQAGYQDTSNWIYGQIIRIAGSSMPLLYVAGVSGRYEIPPTEEECIQLLETNGNVSGGGVTLRKYSEILGGDIGDIDTALDSILAMQNSLIGGDA